MFRPNPKQEIEKRYRMQKAWSMEHRAKSIE
jgi:hypothetical protein